ncbi:MAG: hypothetical protein ACKVP5_04465 [Aestuariivirga sp.]
MMSELHLDWETRGAVDLKKAGLHVYARDKWTDIWLASYAFGDEPVENWFPGQPCPPRIKTHIEGGGIVWGHNVFFEIELCNEVAAKRYGWPRLKVEQCRCTMACAYAMSLPGSLENAAAAVGLEHQKDTAGGRVMMQIAKPRDTAPDGTPIWWDDPAKLQRVAAYGRQDIETERALSKRLLPLSDSELRLWFLDAEINSRGVQVDLPAVKKAIEIVRMETLRLNAEIRQVTNNAVATCTAHQQLRDWLAYRGVSTDSVAKGDVIDLLDGELPDDCRKALLLRQEAAKTSTAKFESMANGACDDGRLRGMFQYHAASTGRWGGRRVQLQNLPRPKLKQAEIDEVFECLR